MSKEEKERLVTDHRIQLTCKAFELLDSNKDGKLDMQDLSVVTQVFRQVSRDDVATSLRNEDIDEDEQLDVPEYQTLLAKQYENEDDRRKEFYSLFQNLQNSSDDKIAVSTLASAICQVDKGASQQQVHELFQQVFPDKQMIALEDLYKLMP
eukprot:ctg_1201.g535